MKYFILILSVFAFSFCPSEAFLGSLVSSLTGSFNNALNAVTDTINTAQLAGQFLWDNALQPSLQVLQQNGVNFIDNYFGSVLNLIGKRSVEKMELAVQKSSILSLYLNETNALISSLKNIFLNFFNDLKNSIQLNMMNIALGQTTIKDVIIEVVKKAKDEINALIQQTIQNINNSTRGFEVVGNYLSNIVSQIGTAVTNAFNALLSSLVSVVG